MKKGRNNCTGASALQVTLSAALISVAAMLLASSFKAAPPASGLSAAIVPPFEGDQHTDSGSWTATGSLNTARDRHTATLLPNGKVLAAGGFNLGSNGSIILSSAELYDSASGTWTLTGSLNTAREGPSATLLPNGKVLVAGGLGGTGFDPTSTELYDSASGTWTVTGSINTAIRFEHTATLLPNGKVLLAGGFPGTLFQPSLSSAELYNPASGTWVVTGSLNTGRYSHTATLLPNGKVLVAGGYSNGPDFVYFSSVELYDSVSGSWTATGGLNTKRAGHTATLLPNGNVLVAGGSNSTGYLSSAELYDQSSESWTVTGSLNTARGGDTATLLPNGKVLVAGGSNSTGYLSSAELYDQASGSWTVTSSLKTVRVGHTATLLPDGKVLAAGGEDNHMFLSSAELYETQSGMCSVCHKHILTLSLACDSAEYRRHLDHGDTVGACPAKSDNTR